MDISKIDSIIDSYKGEASSVMAMMQDIQDEATYVSREAMERIAPTDALSEPDRGPRDRDGIPEQRV